MKLLDIKCGMYALAILSLCSCAHQSSIEPSSAHIDSHATSIETHTGQETLSKIQTQRQTWLNQQALLDDYLPQYQNLIKTGLIGQTQPQLALQQLKHIQQSQHLFPVQYSMSKPQPYKIGFEGVEVVTSNLTLEMDLLHEEDLLTLMQGLRTHHAGSVILRSCKLDSLNATPDMQQLKPNLHAKCALDWLNILPIAALEDGHD